MNFLFRSFLLYTLLNLFYKSFEINFNIINVPGKICNVIAICVIKYDLLSLCVNLGDAIINISNDEILNTAITKVITMIISILL